MLLAGAAGLHRRQGSWNRWVRAVWWVLLLPIAVFCWAASLSSGWPRRAGIALAAFLGLIGLISALSSGEEPNPEPEQAVEANDDAVEPAETTSLDGVQFVVEGTHYLIDGETVRIVDQSEGAQ